jgi:translation elongation factor EF-1alpha
MNTKEKSAKLDVNLNPCKIMTESKNKEITAIQIEPSTTLFSENGDPIKTLMSELSEKEVKTGD